MLEKKKLTQDQLQQELRYDLETGDFIRLGGPCKNKVAGTLHHQGYVQISLLGNLYQAHQLAYLYVEGYFPEGGIDHINSIRHHNAWSNLRAVSQQCNTRNTGNWSTNTSGVKGVYYNNNKQKWQAQIKVNGKGYGLGLFADKENAICSRLSAEQCLNWEGCSSASPAYLHVKSWQDKLRKL